MYIYKLYIRMYLKNREKTQKKEKKLKKKKGRGELATCHLPPPPLFMRVTCPVVQGGTPDWSPISYSGS